MRHSKEIVTAVGTLALAVGIGFVMQSSELAKERYQVRPAPEAPSEHVVKEAPAPVVEHRGASLLPEVSEIHLTSASVPRIASASGMGLLADHIVTHIAATEEPAVTAENTVCGYHASGQVLDGGLIKLSLDAPCYPNERVTIHHNGLMFTETTDNDGGLSTIVPALSERAVVMMQFSNGDGAVVQAHIEGLDLYGRAVLQWRGDAGFQLHAREFGADYGSVGHVWAGSEAPFDSALDNNQGFVVKLGNAAVPEPQLAEVYTYPLAKAEKRGTIDLTIEAEVHARNCGLDIEAQSIELVDGSIRTQDVILSIPDCDAVGSFLVLNNLVSDMKVASN